MSGKTGPKPTELQEYLNERLPEGMSLTITVMPGSKLSLMPSEGMDAEQAMLLLQGGIGAILTYMDSVDPKDSIIH